MKAVIIFAKYPVEGKVKTRLAFAIGNKKAAEFYRVCAEHIFDQSRELNNRLIKTFIFCSAEDEAVSVKEWTRNRFQLAVQRGEDLGERMCNAFKYAFEQGFSSAVLIGTDIPDIDSRVINDALISLNNHDLVVGPSDDGGYYLIGMKKTIPELFTGIYWSSPLVYNETILKARKLSLNIKELDVLTDIDTENELLLWLNRNENSAHPLFKEIKDIYSAV